jgi:hypothetical protein
MTPSLKVRELRAIGLSPEFSSSLLVIIVGFH